MKKFTSHKRGQYSELYILDLRENVKRTCNHLSPSRRFDFDATKQSFAFRELSNLLDAQKYPPISDGTFYNFFTHTSNEGNDGYRFFTFQEKTISILQDFVENNLPKHLLQNSQDKSLFDFETVTAKYHGNSLDERVKNLLFQIYSSYAGVGTSKEQIFVDEKGNVRMVKKRYLRPITDIAFILVESYCDKPGRVVISEALDLDNKLDLDVYTFRKNPDGEGFFILFPEIKKSKSSVNYQLTVLAENYLSDIVDFKSGRREIGPMVNMGLEYLEEEYYFPNTRLYSTLTVSIQSHPNNELVNRIVSPVETNEFKIYKIDHGMLNDFNIPIIVKFEI